MNAAKEITADDRFIIVALTRPMRVDNWPEDKVAPLSPQGVVPASESVPRFMYWAGKDWTFDFDSAHVYPWIKSATYWSGKLAAKAPKAWKFIQGIRVAMLSPEGMEVHLPGPASPADAPRIGEGPDPSAGVSVEISKVPDPTISENGNA